MKYPQTPENPFGQFIVKRIAALNIPRSQIAMRMGYKNVTKALRRLDETIDSGMADKEFLHRIAQGLDIAVPEMNEQIRLMNQYLEKKRQERIEEERQSFEPYILALCTRNIPSPIFVGCMTAHMRIKHVDKECLSFPYIDLLAHIGSLIKEHYTKREGGVPGFGSIVGYVVHRGYDETRDDLLFFNTDGTLTADRFVDKSIILGTCSLTVGGRDILPLLRFEGQE